MEKAYYSEFNTYVSVLPEPTSTLGIFPTSTKRDMSSIGVAFAAVGWEPVGNVFYDYDTHVPGDGAAGACGCAIDTCFTATAYGDVDGDGNIAVIAYAQPDGAGNLCSPGVLGAAPLRPNEPMSDQTQSRY